MSTCKNNTSPDTGRWLVPGFCGVIGVAFLVIGLVNDKPSAGISGLAVMLAYATYLLVFRKRAEPAALLAGDISDERRVSIQVRSSAVTERVLVLVIVAGLFWSLAADNQYVGVFSALAAIGGFTSIGSTIYYSRRG